MMRATLQWVLASVRSFGWAPASVFVLHVVIREFDAYLRWPGLDMPVHFVGGVAIAYFFWSALASEEARPVLGAQSKVGVLLFALALVGTSTVVWEFAEWTADFLGLTTAQVGLDDTMLDMLLGIAGGASFLAIAALRSRKVPAKVAELGEN